MKSQELNSKAARTLSISSVEYQLGYKEALNAAAEAAAADGLNIAEKSPAFAALRDLVLQMWREPAKPAPEFTGTIPQRE